MIVLFNCTCETTLREGQPPNRKRNPMCREHGIVSTIARQLRWRTPWHSRSVCRSWAAALVRFHEPKLAMMMRLSERMHRRNRRAFR